MPDPILSHRHSASGLFAALVLVALTACSTMRSEVEINAPRERVWQILTDFEKYPEWNPFFVRAKGELRPDAELEIAMQPVGKDSQEFSPTVLTVRKPASFAWRGRVLMPGLFDGTHHFEIQTLGRDRVRFIQYEDFSGILVPFVSFDPYRHGWAKMNAALKREAETDPSKRTNRNSAQSSAIGGPAGSP